jgi:predicted phosphodiesterase
MMRVAVFSDVHGNAVAFDAVLADIGRQRVDRLVCLGDAVQGGPQPTEIVKRLRELACPVVIGNADAWLLTGEETGAEGPPTAWQLAMRAWSLAQLSEEDRRFVADFRPTVEIELPAGRRLLAFHGSPRSFDDIILPLTADEEVRLFLGEHGPAILCGGHTHLQQIRHLAETFYFNPGSVGVAYRHDQPAGQHKTDPWAEYALLTVTDDGGLGLEFRRVPFDVERLLSVARASGMPEPDTYADRYRRDS